MAAETPDAASFKKRLPWLKRLQGDLDDDDSSDSSLPMTEPTPKLAVRPTKQKTTTKKKTMLETEGKSYKRAKTKRQVPTREDSDGASSNDSDADRHTKKRLLKKKNDETSSFMRRKRRTEAVKEVSPRNKLKKLSIKHDRSRAVEEQRTQKLHDRRSSAGRSDDMAISKSRREKPYEVRRKKEKTCDVADRLFQKKAQGLICSEADVKGKRDYRIRLSPQPMTDGISFVEERAEKCKLLKNTGAKMAEKTCKGATSPDVAVSDDASGLVKCDGRDTVTTDLGSTVDFTSVPVNNDGTQDSVLKSVNPDQMDEDNGCFPAAVGEKIDGCVQPERLGNLFSVSRELKEPEACMPAEGAGTIATLNTSGEADAGPKSVVAESVPHDPSRPHSKDKMDKQPEPAALAAPERGSNEANNKQNLESSVITPSAESLPKNEDGSGKHGDEKNCRTMALHTKPTVCEETKKERVSAVSYAGSFIIPKRSSGNSCSADETVILPVNRARDIRARGMTDTRSVIPSKHTAVPSLSCVDRCSKFSAVDVVHPSAKRSKNPVPIGAASSCSQDRALLRLSRSRNSIYMAVGELALGATDLRSSKELQTRMMGYEVYDVDGKVLPDLISRYSCATSGEMTSSRKLYTASFFGVSLAPPIAADKTSAAAVKCGSGESGTRNVSCYEELRFGRPEDREFYQQKMYGTAFVPQNLRGQITLVVRNARFERKSTGIRFNQDRDREDFAVSLSKRYTLGKSVPRCEISRDNWLKMMKNQLGSVYLHYYNREDGERASQIFHDDIGHLLELRLKLKAGAVLKEESSCQAARPKLHVSPCRSLSSERSKPESSPLLSQNGGAITPPRQRERRIASKGDDRLSKIDRNAPPPIGPCDRYMERRDNRKYEPGGVFDNNTYDRRSHVDTRHGGYDAYGGGRRSRPR
ncbi:unnamed protein product [Hyaloperonospora brassicae]|uniref:Uncharacterized protein n=1 Tax=Hyaloperonospora brassicae TaxID=162125 RepID=A0AAV0UPU5_HYABA|nr:unnamed protein product [Hyaloperonospora brassicae]